MKEAGQKQTNERTNREVSLEGFLYLREGSV